jgi:hypothetical protein
MLSEADRRERYSKLQFTFRSRSKNLRRIVEAAGGWPQASRLTGKSIQLLKQCCGDNPCRTIGDTLARELEYRLRLPASTLDGGTTQNPT